MADRRPHDEGCAGVRRGGKGRGTSGLGWAAAAFLTLSLLAGAQAQGQCCTGTACNTPTTWDAMLSCPSSHWSTHMSQFPQQWYLINNPGATVTKQCISGPSKFKTCSSDADCGGTANTCKMPAMSASDYIKTYMSCCKHCVWSMKFPVGAPIQVTAGPVGNDANELTGISNLDCNTFAADFVALDTEAADGFLTRTEFNNFLNKVPFKQMVATKMLDSDSVFWIADLNKDKFVSAHEYLILRHFWTPTLISNAAPTQTTGTPLAEGPLGGMFFDNSTVSVWVTTANNMMVRLYIVNSWDSAGTREPRYTEEKEHKRLRDLDGSTRISMDEHYFGEFADIDGDGFLSRAEFDLSLYNPATATGNPARATKSSFEYMDLDGDGKISFIERKRIVADRNENGDIDAVEWAWADFPIEYGPFKGHVYVDGTLKPEQYRYYMAYHGCTIRGSIAYSRPLSEFPWDQGCPININVRPSVPFVSPQSTTRRDGHGIDDQHGGFALRVLGNITERLLWKPTIKYVSADADKTSLETEFGLGPPNVDTGTFELALLTEYQETPADWTCSKSLFPEDGFVLVTRSQDVEIVMYLIAGKLTGSPHFINFFCTLFFFTLVVGHIIWFVEKWSNHDIFRTFYGEGVMDGLWWAIVTQTTVGYGDKAPISGIGKSFAVLWMLFGLIMFGVFSGQVTSFIEEETALNNIASAASLGGFQVGTLTKTRPLQLQQIFAFTNYNCATMEECGDKLSKREISAIVAPRADVVAFFQKPHSSKPTGTPPAFASCGNPFKIVGGTIDPSLIPQAPPAVRVCAYTRSVYGGVYLTQGVSQTLDKMVADGSLQSILVENQEQVYIPPDEGVGDECAPPLPWDITMIVIACTLFAFYAVLITITESEAAQEMIAKWRGKPSPRQLAEESAKAAEEELAKEPTSKPKKEEEDAPKLPGLSKDHAEKMIDVSKKLGVFTAMQATDIRRMQRELKEQRYILERMLKFFGICGLIVVICLAIMVGILIAVWGDKLQIAQYQYD
mmetsp:Transcript_28928/g.69430  ORF Transcript_28928/g.69430 Transcript_28928/m.69430 type:complete len:1016 (+) Transcript_28928:296-3343(+)